jgi:L-aminopeptidase/D-esterase-like protein
VPIVPAAVLFDLWLGDVSIRPDAAAGYAACENASASPPAQGLVGAGTGATVGKLYGIQRAMAGGIGTASLSIGGTTVAALVAVNALGDVIDRDGTIIAGARDEAGRGFAGTTAALCSGNGPPRWLRPVASGSGGSIAGSATTIGVVATDARLTKTQANRLATLAMHGLSRAIDPLTQHDGDTLFALATGRAAGEVPDLSALGALAAEVTARAIRNAVRAAARA